MRNARPVSRAWRAKTRTRNEARSTVAAHYVIIYRVVALRERSDAEILRIIHGRQDVVRVFKSGTVRERRHPESDLQAINSRSALTNWESDNVIELQDWPSPTL